MCDLEFGALQYRTGQDKKGEDGDTGEYILTIDNLLSASYLVEVGVSARELGARLSRSLSGSGAGTGTGTGVSVQEADGQVYIRNGAVEPMAPVMWVDVRPGPGGVVRMPAPAPGGQGQAGAGAGAGAGPQGAGIRCEYLCVYYLPPGEQGNGLSQVPLRVVRARLDERTVLAFSVPAHLLEPGEEAAMVRTLEHTLGSRLERCQSDPVVGRMALRVDVSSITLAHVAL